MLKIIKMIKLLGMLLFLISQISSRKLTIQPDVSIYQPNLACFMMSGYKIHYNGNGFDTILRLLAIYIIDEVKLTVIRNNVTKKSNIEICATFNILYVAIPALYELVSFVYAKYINLILVVVKTISKLPYFGILNKDSYKRSVLVLESLFSIFLNIYVAVVKFSIVPLVVYVATLLYVFIPIAYDFYKLVLNLPSVKPKIISEITENGNTLITQIISIEYATNKKMFYLSLRHVIISYLKTYDAYILYAAFAKIALNQDLFKDYMY
ncbi:hypothetical protein A3Q56_06209 [Intoshia linei]|uniref:Uncharacterized protein n=1 Tax=Intoshia linei TaxID=1819745 RepID=A0A177AVS3_9BILA|nr:hypothetical protein A3Q56_06209 [Intoshia linei]